MIQEYTYNITGDCKKNAVNFGDNFLNFLFGLYIVSLVVLSKNPELAIYSKLFGILIASVFIVQYFFIEKRRIVIPIEIILFFIFICFQAFSYYWASVPFIVLSYTFTLFQILILSLIIINIYYISQSINIVCLALIVGLLINSFGIHSEIGFFVGLGQKNLRISGALANANVYSVSIIVCMIFGMIVYTQSKNTIIKILIFLSSSILLYDLLLTGSRKGIAAMIMVIVFNFTFLSAFSRAVLRKKIRLISTSVVVLTLLVIAVYNSPYYKRFEESIGYLQGDRAGVETMEGRGYLVGVAIENWKEAPLMGTGTGQFRYTESLPLNMRYKYSHNNYAEILSNNGIIGICLYYSIYLTILLGFVKLKLTSKDENQENVINLCISTILIMMFWDNGMVSYYEKFNWLLLSILIAMKFSMNNKKLCYD